MTNENAIKQLKRMKMDISHTGDEYNAIMTAIKALEEQPFMNKPCVSEEVCHDAAVQMWEKIKDLPPVTLEQRTGHWIRQTDDYHDYYECEHCGIAVGLDDIKNYCPNCGANMVEPQESEEVNG